MVRPYESDAHRADGTTKKGVTRHLEEQENAHGEEDIGF